jgi:hypothetical protein
MLCQYRSDAYLEALGIGVWKGMIARMITAASARLCGIAAVMAV